MDSPFADELQREFTQPEFAALEVNPQTEFQLPRPILLTCDPTKRRRGSQSQSRVAGLKVVQDVSELEAESGSNPLPELEVLGEGRIEVPSR